MKHLRFFLGLLIAVLLVCAGAYHLLNRPDPSPGVAPVLEGATVDAPLLARGEYLAKAADCVACHTVRDGGRPFAGGVPFVLPFGTLYSSNISPDPTTGIGRYTDDEFVRALHDGVRSDGKRLYPAFPYTSYTQLSRADALAIKAYLFSLAPVVQANRSPDLIFPFNQRWAMGFWNAVFFRNARFAPDPSRTEEWNRGAYLATALEHCGECHTPRNLGFALEHGNELAGEVIQGWRAPNLTSDAEHGLGAWSPDQLASYLLNGHAEGRGSAAGPMGEAVENSLQYLRPADVGALVTYLKTVPARTGNDPVTIDAKPAPAASASALLPDLHAATDHEAGMKLFASACSSCHQWNGPGRQVSHASLVGSRSVNDPQGANVTQMILEGVNITVQGKAVFMPKFGQAYSDAEVAALANFVIEQFGNKKGTVTAETVARQRQKS